MSTFKIPLSPIEVRARDHAIASTVGFLILLPLGVLLARYTRTLPYRWFHTHWPTQVLLAGPVIAYGWAQGYRTTAAFGTGHFRDPHEKMGLALLVLYVAQLLLGMGAHFFKGRGGGRGGGGVRGNGGGGVKGNGVGGGNGVKGNGGMGRGMARGGGRGRLPHAYAHAVLGLVIFACAQWQVHYGLFTEWAFATGGLHAVPASAKHAWLALVIVFWVLYAAGLALLPRQYAQERAARDGSVGGKESHSQTQTQSEA